MRGPVFALCLAVSGPATALDAIRDAGGEPIAPYLARLAPPIPAPRQPLGTPFTRADRTVSLAHYLPVRSPSLSPGPVEARRAPTRLVQPLFLLGADPESIRWLEANRDRLRQLHAIGMLVQAETESDLEAVTVAAQGIPLIPASGEAFAEALQVRHYPVLITREGIRP
jgi:integrating conjugative element protein (TIGR03765 family)